MTIPLSQESPVVTDKEVFRSFAEQISKFNYSWEAFESKTADGYILGTFHITGKTFETPKSKDKK